MITTTEFFPLGTLSDAEWSPDGETLIVTTDRDFQIVDAESLDILHSVQGYEFVHFLQDGDLLLRDEQGLPSIFDMQSFELNSIDVEIPGPIYAISSDGKVIAGVSSENKVKRIDIESGETTEFTYYLKDYAEISPQAVTFSPNQKYLYVFNFIPYVVSELLVFDLEKEQLLSQNSGINGLPSFSPDNKRLVFMTVKYVSLYTSTMGPWYDLSAMFSTSLNDEENVFYNGVSYSFIQDSSRIGILYQGTITNYAKDEQRLTATILIYDTNKGSIERFINDIPATSFDLGFSPDGSEFFTLSEDGFINIWQASNGELLRTSQAYKPNTNIAVSPDGSLFAYFIGDTARIVNAIDGEIVTEIMDPNSSREKYVTFQGNNIIAISSNNQTNTYTIDTGEWIRNYPQLAYCDFNPTGTTMICAGSDFELYDTETGRALIKVRPSNYSYRYAVSDDGAYTAFCNANSETVFLYDTQSGEQIQFLKLNNQPACGSLDFSADGQFLVSSIGAVWQIPEGDLILEISAPGRGTVSIPPNNEFVLIYPGIYSLENGAMLTRIEPDIQITDVWFHPNGFDLILLGENTLQFWGVLE